MNKDLFMNNINLLLLLDKHSVRQDKHNTEL